MSFSSATTSSNPSAGNSLLSHSPTSVSPATSPLPPSAGAAGMVSTGGVGEGRGAGGAGAGAGVVVDAGADTERAGSDGAGAGSGAGAGAAAGSGSRPHAFSNAAQIVSRAAWSSSTKSSRSSFSASNSSTSPTSSASMSLNSSTSAAICSTVCAPTAVQKLSDRLLFPTQCWRNRLSREIFRPQKVGRGQLHPACRTAASLDWSLTAVATSPAREAFMSFRVSSRLSRASPNSIPPSR